MFSNIWLLVWLWSTLAGSGIGLLVGAWITYEPKLLLIGIIFLVVTCIHMFYIDKKFNKEKTKEKENNK